MINREGPRRLASCAAIAALCVSAGATARAAQVQPGASAATSDTTVRDLDVPVVIQAADWIYFPSHVARRDIAGKVVLKCKVLPTTSVSDCSVVSAVSDAGPSKVLGDVALKASAEFKIRPRMVNGTLSDNAWVLIPISFNEK